MIKYDNLTIFFGVLIILITNSYPDVTTNLKSFSDQKYYLSILESSPNFPEEKIGANQGQRFFFIYIIGSILEILNIKKYWHPFFLFLNIINFFIICSLLKRILSKLKIHNHNEILYLILLILIFNPYFFRVCLNAPLMINDYIFINGLLFTILSLQEKKKLNFILGLVICSLSRQTSMVIIPALLIMIFHNVYFKKKVDIFFYFSSILTIFLTFIITLKISESFITSTQYSSFITGIFITDTNFKKYALSYFRIFLANYVVFFIFIKFHRKLVSFDFLTNETYVFIFLLSCGVWAQPLLAGPTLTLGNEARLTIMSLPLFLIFFTLYNNLKLSIKNKILIFFLLFISSLHHKYSFLSSYDFKNYLLLILTLPSIIYFFYLLVLRKTN